MTQIDHFSCTCARNVHVFLPQKCPETPHPIPAPQVSHTGSHSSLLITFPCTPVLLATAPLRGPSAPRLSAERKASAARDHSAAASSPRGTCLRSLRQEPLPCAIIVPSPSAAAPASALLRQEPLAAVCLYPGNLSSEPSFVPARRLPLCAVPQITFRAPPTLGGSYPAQPAADPTSCLSTQGITARLAPFPKSGSLHRSAHRTPGTPRCRLLLPISAP